MKQKNDFFTAGSQFLATNGFQIMSMIISTKQNYLIEHLIGLQTKDRYFLI